MTTLLSGASSIHMSTGIPNRAFVRSDAMRRVTMQKYAGLTLVDGKRDIKVWLGSTTWRYAPERDASLPAAPTQRPLSDTASGG
jgi:hypothetical protein